jgi:hypothetical protein
VKRVRIDSDPAVADFLFTAVVSEITLLREGVEDFVALEESEAGSAELYHRVLGAARADLRTRPRRRPLRLPTRKTGRLPHRARLVDGQARRRLLLHRPLIEYFGDWFLIERTEEDVLRCCDAAGIPREAVSITREESGSRC